MEPRMPPLTKQQIDAAAKKVSAELGMTKPEELKDIDSAIRFADALRRAIDEVAPSVEVKDGIYDIALVDGRPVLVPRIATPEPPPPAPPPPPPPPPEPPKVLFLEDFKTLSLEDGQAATKGAKWADSFVTWGVRHLEGNFNIDWKKWLQNKTHVLTSEGLSLRVLKESVATGFPYTSAMISSERSFSFLYGIVEFEIKFSNLGPGGHFTAWLIRPKTNSWPPEIDMIEMVDSNLDFPNGGMNHWAMNAIETPEGDAVTDGKGNPIDPGISFIPYPAGFWKTFHKVKFVWTKTWMEWHVDGVLYRRQPTFVHDRMAMLFGWEFGAGGDPKGSFPNAPNAKTTYPQEVVIRSIKVTSA